MAAFLWQTQIQTTKYLHPLIWIFKQSWCPKCFWQDFCVSKSRNDLHTSYTAWCIFRGFVCHFSESYKRCMFCWMNRKLFVECEFKEVLKLGSLIWSRDIICLHILLHRKKFLCCKICKQIMYLDQMRDPTNKEKATDNIFSYCFFFFSFSHLS